MTAGLAERRRGVRQLAQAWVRAHEPEFGLASDDPEERQSFLKRNSELAAIAGMLVDAGDAEARGWIERCWQRFERGAVLAREIETMPALATTYVPFWRHGLRSAELEHAIASHAARATHPALRMLIGCALRACELPAPWDVDQLLAESWLASEPATWLITAEQAYIAAHVVLFLAPRGLVPAQHVPYLLRSLPVWIAHFVRAGDLDLLAELVVVAHALGTCVPASEWQVLIDAQETDGMVPFRLAWRNREVAPHVRFHGNYHSTLLTLAACATCAH